MQGGAAPAAEALHGAAQRHVAQGAPPLAHGVRTGRRRFGESLLLTEAASYKHATPLVQVQRALRPARLGGGAPRRHRGRLLLRPICPSITHLFPRSRSFLSFFRPFSSLDRSPAHFLAFIDRWNEQVRYVLDFYSGQMDPKDPKPVSMHLDVRPALDSVEVGMCISCACGEGIVPVCV